jgi:predicted nucleic acid-binding protein
LTVAEPVALLDANVLYPIGLVDLLLRLAEAGLYVPRWSAAIHEEWTRNLRADRPDLADRVDRRRRAMELAFPAALVTGYEPLAAGLNLPDPDDRHVLAAAVCGAATEVVTFNLGDFPADRLAPYRLVATHPDVFVVRLTDDTPARALPVLRSVAAAYARGTESPVARFDRLGLSRTAALILAAGL